MPVHKSWFYGSLGALLPSLGFVALAVYYPAALAWITREDSLAESVSAVCYLLAAGFLFAEWAKRDFRNFFVFGYGLLFFFVGGEEISWGQRILGLETPALLAANNVQESITLHNVDGVQQHVRKAGVLVVLTIAILIPLARQWMSSVRTLLAKWSVPVVPLWTAPLTILAILFMVAPRWFLSFDHMLFKFDEIGELYLSLTFLLFAISVKGAGTNRTLPHSSASSLAS